MNAAEQTQWPLRSRNPFLPMAEFLQTAFVVMYTSYIVSWLETVPTGVVIPRKSLFRMAPIRMPRSQPMPREPIPSCGPSKPNIVRIPIRCKLLLSNRPSATQVRMILSVGRIMHLPRFLLLATEFGKQLLEFYSPEEIRFRMRWRLFRPMESTVLSGTKTMVLPASIRIQ